MRAYISHPIRGIKGAAATEADMIANNQRAMKFASCLRQACPSLELYVPAEHDEFVLVAYRLGILSEDPILQTDEEIVRSRDMLIVFCPDKYISGGMKKEIYAAQAAGIPVVYTIGDVEPVMRALEGFKR